MFQQYRCDLRVPVSNRHFMGQFKRFIAGVLYRQQVRLRFLEMENNEELFKTGLCIWLGVCFGLCIWFLRSFIRGRRVFHNNLHVIEDGLRRMQEELQRKQRENSVVFDEDMKDIAEFCQRINNPDVHEVMKSFLCFYFDLIAEQENIYIYKSLHQIFIHLLIQSCELLRQQCALCYSNIAILIKVGSMQLIDEAINQICGSNIQSFTCGDSDKYLLHTYLQIPTAEVVK